MCDYSLQTFKSRPAAVGDKLVVTNFGMGTRGFADINDGSPLASTTAVCVLPGTELAFAEPVRTTVPYTMSMAQTTHEHSLARFRQIDKEHLHAHHDVLEFPDGKRVMLTHLVEGQCATVLQLPAAPKNEIELQEQTRAAFV